MSERTTWRSHVAEAITDIRHAMKDISTDGPSAWKEGLLIEAVQKLETALMDDDQDAD